MKQNFSGDIGQVAGRDVNATSTLSNFNLYFHNVRDVRYISERQRNAIARRALNIQVKTGTDKLIVYRRLMTVFNVPNMDEIPTAIYKRVISYLNAWLKNGWTDETAGARPRSSASSHDRQSCRTEVAPELATFSTPAPAFHTSPSTSQQPVSTFTHTQDDLSTQWHMLTVMLAVVAALAVSVCVVVWSSMTPGGQPLTAVLLRCEYGGHRYSLGSIVAQAGTLLRCVEVDKYSVTWQAMTDSKLPRNENL
ncbi:hypothetical protein J2785_003381 [Burkholderia ambifaria]|nr:hypothetical protein [Burkholderia ambifaria]MDR6500225.1 hypothetical protein [Burkholderia ambifaria]